MVFLKEDVQFFLKKLGALCAPNLLPHYRNIYSSTPKPTIGRRKKKTRGEEEHPSTSQIARRRSCAGSLHPALPKSWPLSVYHHVSNPLNLSTAALFSPVPANHPQL
jgi:hypothetical protein